MVIRRSSAKDEGAVWWHEYGHNLGLRHTSDAKNVMSAYANTDGGMTSAQCSTFGGSSGKSDGSDGGSSCFARDATVEVAGRGRVRVDELREGDMVADGSAAGHSAFVTYLHADLHRETAFVALHVAGLDRPLVLTGEHLVFVQRRDSAEEMEAVRADAVRVGDVVARGNGTRAVVERVETRKQTGFVAPLTASGQLVVEGVVASCYADMNGLGQTVSHTAMKPLVWLSKMFPALSRQATSHTEIHWYAQVLVKLAQAGAHAGARVDELRGMLHSHL